MVAIAVRRSIWQPAQIKDSVRDPLVSRSNKRRYLSRDPIGSRSLSGPNVACRFRDFSSLAQLVELCAGNPKECQHVPCAKAHWQVQTYTVQGEALCLSLLGLFRCGGDSGCRTLHCWSSDERCLSCLRCTLGYKSQCHFCLRQRTNVRDIRHKKWSARKPCGFPLHSIAREVAANYIKCSIVVNCC